MMASAALYVAWQDPESSSWYPVGRLTKAFGEYCFVYLQGAKESRHFVPFGRMTKLNSAYLSDTLFPLFANRLLPKSRPEYGDYLQWLGLGDRGHDDMELLARSGGLRATDSLELFPHPLPTEGGNFSEHFMSHGIRYLSTEDQKHIKTLKAGERLYLMEDVQNPHDPSALLLRTPDPIHIVGYSPRYFARTLKQLGSMSGMGRLEIRVERVNPDAPAQLRLQCHVTAPWPPGFAPFNGGEFTPLAEPRFEPQERAAAG